MKTMATTEAVSSVGMEKRVERHICQRSAPVIREKPRVDWKMDLQYCGTGRKSGKHPTLVVGKKPYGKSQLRPIRRSERAGWTVPPALARSGSPRSPIWNADCN